MANKFKENKRKANEKNPKVEKKEKFTILFKKIKRIK